ncbi:MAG: hypothetical protein J1F29_05760 [Lentimicrobiaceae bacterium]|nr:hypothetical protein [Lentimicrobiaceae bacterium]
MSRHSPYASHVNVAGFCRAGVSSTERSGVKDTEVRSPTWLAFAETKYLQRSGAELKIRRLEAQLSLEFAETKYLQRSEAELKIRSLEASPLGLEFAEPEYLQRSGAELKIP